MRDEVIVGSCGPGDGRTRFPTVTTVHDRNRRGRRVRRHDERGAVTAEAAVVIPLLLAVTMALVWLVALAATQVRVVDAAREAARAAARGESDAASVERGRQVAPDGARFQVSRSGDTVTVRVTSEVSGPGGLLAFLPAVPVSSEAVAAEEPAAAEGTR
jgi:Flp pilus assembly protein TadG